MPGPAKLHGFHVRHGQRRDVGQRGQTGSGVREIARGILLGSNLSSEIASASEKVRPRRRSAVIWPNLPQPRQARARLRMYTPLPDCTSKRRDPRRAAGQFKPVHPRRARFQHRRGALARQS